MRTMYNRYKALGTTIANQIFNYYEDDFKLIVNFIQYIKQ